MRWSEIERSQPRLAELGRRRLLGPGVVLVGTIRRDGTRRISPVEPFVMDGDLWLIMMWRSTKAIDLTRDPRILVHSVITSRDGGEGEYKVRGTVHAQTDVAAQRRLADSVEKNLGWRPEPGRGERADLVELITSMCPRGIEAFDDQLGAHSGLRGNLR